MGRASVLPRNGDNQWRYEIMLYRDIQRHQRFRQFAGDDPWAGLDRNDNQFGANTPAVVPGWAIIMFYGCLALTLIGLALAT